MGRCETIWRTTGGNRVCSKCLALKDKIVGHTDEASVQLPPLHPRCRCMISYREIEEPKTIPTVTPRSLNDKIKLNINGFGEACIPIAKLTKYALNPEKAPDKALAFEKALGYNLTNVDELIENVIRNINNFEPELKDKTIHGELFQILMELKGVNGKTAHVMTGWIVDAATSEVRLTSIYVKKRKTDKNAD